MGLRFGLLGGIIGGPWSTGDVGDPENRAAGTSRLDERRICRGEGTGEGSGVNKLGDGVLRGDFGGMAGPGPKSSMNKAREGISMTGDSRRRDRSGRMELADGVRRGDSGGIGANISSSSSSSSS